MNTLDYCEVCRKPKPTGTQSASEDMSIYSLTPLHGATAADRSINRHEAEAPNTAHGETTAIERVQHSIPTVREINLSIDLLNTDIILTSISAHNVRGITMFGTLDVLLITIIYII